MPSAKLLELSFPLPKTPHVILHLHLTFLATSLIVFLTTTTIGDSGSTTAPLGSFVYAMPGVCIRSRDSSLFLESVRLYIYSVSILRMRSALLCILPPQASITPTAQQRYWLAEPPHQYTLDAVPTSRELQWRRRWKGSRRSSTPFWLDGESTVEWRRNGRNRLYRSDQQGNFDRACAVSTVT